MKLREKARDIQGEINLTPLIDVVFLLLIFFMVTTTFERHARLKIELPEATEDAVQKPSEPIEIAITDKGRFFVNNSEVVNNKVTTVREAIERIAGEDRDQPITIRADANTPHQHVVTAMDAVSQLGFVNVSIATTPGSG
ncbi:MAG: biopolymer transporter ExbD [Xanthomonadales bacterium]|nr:biopolymer transporter ExbD [Xanthomonadales bacterium]